MKLFIFGTLALLLPLAFLKLCYALGTVLVLRRTGGALFVSTSRAKIRALLEALGPLSPETSFVDLGCGDGRLLRAMYRRFGILGVGYEINPWAYVLARFKNFLAGVPAEIRREDFFAANLKDYDLIFCYLFPDVLKDLAPKLRKEAKEGAVIVSANFPLPGWKPYLILKEEDPIYFYRKGT